MNDKELADAVVALGVGGQEAKSLNFYYAGQGFTAADFVRDWRVAGALMEKVDAVYVEALTNGRWQAQAHNNAELTSWYVYITPARAIIEACVEALGKVD
jgi:hypothetical protein